MTPSARRPPSPPPAVTTEPAISLPLAFGTWACGWLAGNVAGAIVLAPHADTPVADRPVWVSAAGALALWVPQIVALVVVGRRFATGRFTTDYSLRFRPIDLVGIPVGVLSQLVLLRLVYWPLQSLWPGAFADKELEENARDLYDKATGGWLVLLIAVVVIGAPLVEELVYRGLLQGAARRRLDDIAAVVLVAAFFALIHFRPVEYPGLLMFGLVLGVCAWTTDRIGLAIVAHMAFNATGLALVAR